ncbi:MAG TPA: hypothetical protein VFJ51_03190 [Nitrososphaeraceae archaeon]|nr:hypothetical protein [Nitrososphaeraceae archaeon]
MIIGFSFDAAKAKSSSSFCMSNAVAKQTLTLSFTLLISLHFLGNLLRTIIIPINEAELRKNTAQGVKAATIKPPTMGPTTRPMLLARALRVRALGSSDLDTSPLIVGIMGVLIIVVPAPSAKVSISNTVGLVRPTRVKIPSAVDIVNMYAHVIRSMLRRSKISDSIPDGNANRKIGSAVAVVIRETNKGFGARSH